MYLSLLLLMLLVAFPIAPKKAQLSAVGKATKVGKLTVFWTKKLMR